MSELEEIKATIPEKKLEPIKRLSPSSINTYYKCPREFYYTYIDKQPIAPNINLVKGSIIHKVLENFFKGYNKAPKTFIRELFVKEWKANEKQLRNLELTSEELSTHKKDSFKMVMNYYETHKRKVDGMIISGKAENQQHAFFLVKPKFREMWVEDKELHCAGYIDRINEDYNGVITLGDYKTSSKYGIGLPIDYKRQLSIYALLHYKQNKVMADFVSIIFLRYGEEFLLEVTPSLLKFARTCIDDVWARTRSADIEDYPLHEGSLCKWCPFKNICSGGVETDRKKRLENMKKIIEAKNE